MRHQVPIRDFRSIMHETIRHLPDGRRLVIRPNQRTKLIDPEGNETSASASELIALTAVCEMYFPKNLTGEP